MHLIKRHTSRLLPVCPSAPVRFSASLIPARFLERRKRFLALVELPDRRQVWVHVPNSGALTGCAYPGQEILLTDDASPGAQNRLYLAVRPGRRRAGFASIPWSLTAWWPRPWPQAGSRACRCPPRVRAEVDHSPGQPTGFCPGGGREALVYGGQKRHLGGRRGGPLS